MNGYLQTNKRLFVLLVAFFCGMQLGWAYAPSFSKTCSTGQTLYYAIIDATNHYVALTSPGGHDNNPYDCLGWENYTKPTGNITIPSTVTYNGTTYTVKKIGAGAFWDCTGLTGTLTLPSTVTEVEYGGFRGCCGFTSLNLSNVEIIGPAAFYKCYGFTGNLTIPNTTTYLGNTAFACCSFSGTLTIGSSVEYIDSTSPFENCCVFYNGSGIDDHYAYNDFSTIVVNSSNSVFDSRNNCNAIIRTSDNTLVYGHKNTTIPNTVSSIASNAFYGCLGLTSIEIPNSVTAIGNYAFIDCENLNLITCLAQIPPTIDQYSFGWDSQDIPVKVPCGTWADYHAANYWSEFVNLQELGTINGHFSVDEAVYVNFSQGNLQYQASTNTWRFAENQWDYVGSSNNSASSTYSGWIDLFGWGTSGYNHGATNYRPWNTTTTNSYYYAYGSATYNLYDQTGKADWGYNAIYNGCDTENDGWRTLTNAEWQYVFNSRSTTSGIRYAKAKVNNISGVILLPDDWQTSYYSLSNTNSASASFTSNTITASQWVTLEQHGAVFLPAAGYRNGTTVNSVGSYGYYWSSTYASNTNAYGPYFYASSNNAGYSTNRYYGRSVRLVRPIQNCVINATPNSTQYGQVNGAGAYMVGSNCTLTATPTTGYHFVNWTENGTVVSSNASYSFTVNRNRTLVANFSINTYSITATASPTEGGTVSGTGTYNHGSSCTLTATPSSNYSFYRWTKNGSYVSYSSSYTIYSVTESASYVAEFNKISYYITAQASPAAGGTVTGGGSYEIGSTVTLTATPATGYSFVNWTKNGAEVSTNATYSFTATASGTYIANFSLVPYTITTTANPNNGGTVVSFSDVVNNSFEDNTIPSEWSNSVSSYPWTIWSSNPHGGSYCMASSNYHISSSESYIEATVDFVEDGSVDFYSRISSESVNYDYGCFYIDGTQKLKEGGTSNTWTSRHYEVVAGTHTFRWYYRKDGSGNSGEDRYFIDDIIFTGCFSESVVFHYGETCEVRATANDHYTFQNWTENGSVVSTDATYTFTVTGDRALVANFSPDSYTITASANPSSGGTVNGAGSYNYGSSCTLSASAAAGYTFTRWTKNGTQVSTSPNYTFTVTESASYVAVFTLNSYSISVSANPSAGGTVSGAGSYNHGSTVTLTATPATGYTFVNWTKNGSVVSTSPTYSFTATTAGTYVANFTLNSYEITASANPTEGGTVTGNGTYDHFATCTLIATANEGYTFVNWTENGEFVSESASYEFMVAGARTLVANFSLNSYEIAATANPTEGGTVTGSGNYDHGTTVTLTASANTGYTFVNWTKNGSVVSTSPTYSFTATEAGTYVAHFNINSYEITAFADPAIGGTVTGDGTYNYGTAVTLTATAEEGYTFQNWTKGTEVVSTNPSYSFTVTEAGAYTAHFSLNTYTVTAVANPTEAGTITGAGSFTHGETCTLTVTTTFQYGDYQYVFQNWTENGEVVSTDNTISFVVTANRQLVANFSQVDYHWTSPTGMSGSMVILGILKIDGVEPYADYLEIGAFSGEECRGRAMPQFIQGYCIYSLNVAGNTDGDIITFRLYDHHANQELDLHCTNELTFVNGMSYGFDEFYVFNFVSRVLVSATANPAEGGSVSGIGGYFPGLEATLIATANTGYTFLNWTLNGNVVSNEAEYTFTVTEAASYVANFSLNSYAIGATANPTEGGVVSGAGTYNHFATCTLTATAATGYTFLNWTLEGAVVSTDAEYTFEVSGAGDYVANFVANSYEITTVVDPEGAGTVSGAGPYDYSTQCTLTATANTGYTFLNWTLDGSVVSTDAEYTFTVTEAASYVAHFSLNSYEISAAANPTEGGIVSGAGTYNHFATCTLTATAATGYTFENWTLDGEVVSTDASYAFEVSGPANYVANFVVNSYEITATVDPEGTGIVSGAGTYNHFAQCTLIAIPATGYMFVSWTLDGVEVSTDASYTFEVVGQANYVAHFTLNSYEITATADPTAGGTVSGSGTYNHFASCTLTATANTGYTFQNWTLDGVVVSSEASYTFEVDGPADYVAHFTLASYEVVAIASPSEGGVITGIGNYEHFATCTLTAIANEGYLFNSWIVDGETVSTESTYTFVVTGPVTVMALFDMEQIVELVQGWTWWGTSIEQNGINGLAMLENSLNPYGRQIKTSNKFVQYNTMLGWTGSLNALTNEAGYRIETTAACTSRIVGHVANPEDHPITLSPNWTWIGYPVAHQQTVTEALAGLEPLTNDLIKSQCSTARYISEVGWIPANFILNPGESYMYYSKAAEAKTLVFANGRSMVRTEQDNRFWRNNIHGYADNLSLLAVVEIDGEEQRSEEVELAAFVDGECRGSAKLMYVPYFDRYYAMMNVMGEEGDEVAFAMVDRQRNMTSSDTPNHLTFTVNAIVGDFDEPFVVNFGEMASIGENAMHLGLYPNPIRRDETFHLLVPEGETVTEISVINALGAVVRHETGALNRHDMEGLPVTGVYLVRVVCKSGNVYQSRLVVK